MSDRSPYDPETLSMMCSVLEQTAKVILDGRDLDDVIRKGVRTSLASIILAEMANGQIEFTEMTRRVIAAYRRRAAEI
jgi:hypothetical protein